MATERVEGPAPAPTTARIVLLVLGAAGLIIGSLLAWLRIGGALGAALEAAGQDFPSGIEIPFSAYYSAPGPGSGGTDVTFFTSAGIVTILLGVLALIGIVIPWLARLAGALGIVAFVLFLVTVYRFPTEPTTGTNLSIGNIGLGMWLVLLGSILSLIGGFLVARRTVVTTTTAPTDVPPEP